MEIIKYKHRMYNRKGVDCYKDEIRNILVQATPEEQVRKDVIKTLIECYSYPTSTLSTEYLIKSKNRNMRADIVIFLPTDKTDKNGNIIEKAFVVIECKSRDVQLTQDTFEQGVMYCDELNADYLVITNGDTSFCYKYNDEINDYDLIMDIPNYCNILNEGWFPKLLDLDRSIERPTLELIRDKQWLQQQYNEFYSDWVIGLDTPKKFWGLTIDLYHLLLESNLYITKPILWLGYTFLEDLGVSLHTFGNSAGGKFFGEYRSFLIKDRIGNHNIVRFNISAVGKTKNDPVFKNSRGRTYLNVAVCNGEKMHNSLQLCIDDYITVNSNSYIFSHSGRMTVGNLGSIKTQRVIDYLKENEPNLIQYSTIYLGSVPNNVSLRWDDVKEVILNLAVYALLRDDLRNIITTEKQTQ